MHLKSGLFSHRIFAAFTKSQVSFNTSSELDGYVFCFLIRPLVKYEALSRGGPQKARRADQDDSSLATEEVHLLFFKES